MIRQRLDRNLAGKAVRRIAPQVQSPSEMWRFCGAERASDICDLRWYIPLCEGHITSVYFTVILL